MKARSFSLLVAAAVLVGCDAAGPDALATADGKSETGGMLTPILGTPSSLGDYCVGTYSAHPNPASNWSVVSGAAFVSGGSFGVTIETDGSNQNPIGKWVSQGSQYADTIPRDLTSHCLTLDGPTQVGEFCNVDYVVSKPGTVQPYPSIDWDFNRDIYVNGPGSAGYPRSLSILTDDAPFTITVTTPVGTLTKTVDVSSQYSCP